MEEEIKRLIQSNSWFEIEEPDEDEDVTTEILAFTRDHGNVGDETYGEADMRKAYELKKLLEDKFKCTCEVEDVDEWVHLSVTFNK